MSTEALSINFTTPLHDAVRKLSITEVSKLLRNKADINCIDQLYQTPYIMRIQPT